jgi:hypothetical protein
MTLNYEKVWEVMNELELTVCKVSTARDILDSAIDALGSGNREKAEKLMYAADEFLKYYLDEFDEKFKDAWNKTVVELGNQNKDDFMPPWGHSDLEYLANDYLTLDRITNFPDNQFEPDHYNFWVENNDLIDPAGNDLTDMINTDKKSWVIPVEVDSTNGEYFIQFPDELLKEANLKEGDTVDWIDNNDGTFILKKVNGK